MVVSYFSRRREFRADEGGAKLAGSASMIDALKALKKSVETIGVEEHASLATLKISGSPSGFMALLATHPPIEVRIARLEAMR
jgi:heat shock protein HtpX